MKKFDPEDREPNAMGGINRTSYAIGSGIKLAGFLLDKTLKDEIKKAIDNFMQPSGDKKYDADVILDDMLEELGTDRDEIDQNDILDAYDEIYATISKPDLPAVDLRETILPTGDIVSKQLKVMRLTEEIQPSLLKN